MPTQPDYIWYPPSDLPRQPTAIFDMDGTLVDTSPIQHLVLGDHKDFHKFHTESINCKPHEVVAELARTLEDSGIAKVCIVTSREGRYRGITEAWLDEHSIPYSHIYHRANDDPRPSQEVKSDSLDLISRLYSPYLAVEDHAPVIAMYISRGLDVLTPPWEGLFFY